MNRKHELLVNTLIIGIGTIFTKSISFLLLPFLTIWLSPKEFGNYDLLNSYMSLLVPIMTLQIEQSVLRYTMENSEEESSYFTVGFYFVLGSSLFFFILFDTLLNFEHSRLFFITSILYALQVFFIEFLRGVQKLKLYSLSNIICGLLNIILVFVFLGKLNLGVEGLFISIGISYLITIIFITVNQNLFYYFKVNNFKVKILRKLLKYSIPLLPNALSWWVTSVSDRTLIKLFLGDGLNGIYAVSNKIPTLIAIFYSIFNVSWQQSAILSMRDEFEDRKKFINDTFDKLISFLFSGAIFIISITPLIYNYFISPKYIGGIYIVPILLLATVFLNLGQFFGGILLGEKDTKSNGLSTVFAAVINIVLNILFIDFFGITAAAIATLISYIVLFLMRLVKLKKLFIINNVFVKVFKKTIYFVILSIIVLYYFKSRIVYFFLVFSSIYFIIENSSILFTVLKKRKD